MTIRTASLIALLLMSTTAAFAGDPEMAVPVDVQIALFANVLKLDRNFDTADGATFAIVYQRDYRESLLAKDDFLTAVARLKLSIGCIVLEAGSQDHLRAQLNAVTADVIYVAPLRAVDVHEIAQIARHRNLRTFTGVPAYVDIGVAVGIGIRNSRPLILVNLAGARAEGSDFSSQLLGLARIVGPR